MRTEEVAVSGRRLGEAVDLFLECDDLLARFLERAHQPLVLVDDTGEVALCLGEPLFELAKCPGRVGEPAAEHRNFFFEEGELSRQLVRLLLQSRGTSLGIVTSGHAPTSSRRSHAHYEPISASHAWGAEPPQHFSPPSAHLDVNLWPDVAGGVAPAPPGPVAGS